MLTCSKEYRDLPFAHRQHHHDGHCRFIHGHNWSFRFTFAATEREEGTGFVVDFGKLKYLKAWLEDRFDHTLVLAESDPIARLDLISQLKDQDLVDLVLLPDNSCEGIAQFLLEEVHRLVQASEGGRVHVVKVEVWEDGKNSTTATWGETDGMRWGPTG